MTITTAENLLATTLADVAAFRTLCEAADAEAALEHVHVDALPPSESADGAYTAEELADYLPYALIETDPDRGYLLRAIAVNHDGHYDFADSGRLILRLVRATPEDGDSAEVEASWKTVLGNILTGLATLAGKPGYLAIVEMELVELVRFHPDDEPGLGDQQGAKLRIQWGGAD